jgi:hypothetical protein
VLGDVLFCVSPTLLLFVARATMARAFNGYAVRNMYYLLFIQSWIFNHQYFLDLQSFLVQY